MDISKPRNFNFNNRQFDLLTRKKYLCLCTCWWAFFDEPQTCIDKEFDAECLSILDILLGGGEGGDEGNSYIVIPTMTFLLAVSNMEYI